MNLTALSLENWLCHRHKHLQFRPFTAVAGPNESGKSAICDAISFAILGTLRRIHAKGDRPLLLTAGSDKGSVTLWSGDISVSRNIRDGKLKKADPMPIGNTVVAAVPYCLDSTLFARATPDERRMLLLAVMRVPMDGPSLKQILLERGHAKAEGLKDAGSFSDWVQACQVEATVARQLWKHTTGETYGAVKAAAWQEPKPPDPLPEEMIQRLEQDIGGLRSQAAGLREQIGADRERIANIARQTAKVAQLREKVANFDEIKASLTLAQANLADAKRKETIAAEAEADIFRNIESQTLTCVRCGTHHKLENGRLVLTPRPGPIEKKTNVDLTNARALASSAKTNVSVYETAVRTANGRLDEALQAERELREIGAVETIETDTDRLTKAIRSIEDYQIPSLQTQLEDAKRTLRDVEEAKEKTDLAMSHHLLVGEWTKLAEAVAPDGLPAELLDKAIGPFNARLAQLADAFFWVAPIVGTDMAITRGPFTNSLLSESAEWKIDLLITLAIAELSGFKAVVIDRTDVLDVPSRKSVLVSLYRLTKQKVLDSVILAGTFTQPLLVPEDAASIWLGQ